MRSDIVSGAVFPDYELTDHTTKRRKLSELQGQHPMVLINAGRTGTSQPQNSKRRGSKAARNSSIRMAKRTPKLSVNRIRR